MEIKMLKSKIKSVFYGALATTLMIPFQMAQAQDLSESLQGLVDASETGTQLVFVVSALVGVALMIAGGLQLKKYADNPQQNGIAKPMIYLLAGVLVFGVVATSETMEETLFGEAGGKKAVDLKDL